jgi:hypothetical protein
VYRRCMWPIARKSEANQNGSECESCCRRLRLLSCRVSSGFGRSDDAGFFLARGGGLHHALPKSRNPPSQHSHGRQVAVAHADARCPRTGRPRRSDSWRRHFVIWGDPDIWSVQSRRISMDCPGEIIDRTGPVGSTSSAVLSHRRTDAGKALTKHGWSQDNIPSAGDNGGAERGRGKRCLMPSRYARQ